MSGNPRLRQNLPYAPSEAFNHLPVIHDLQLGKRWGKIPAWNRLQNLIPGEHYFDCCSLAS